MPWASFRQGILVRGLQEDLTRSVRPALLAVLGAAFCFWTVQAKEATHVFTYGGDGLASYPLDVYRGSVRRFFTFVVPLAFVNYEPALYLLGRPDPLGLPDAARLLSPVAALAMAGLARFGWQQGVRHYQSTGS